MTVREEAKIIYSAIDATTNTVEEKPFSAGKLIVFALFNVLLAYLSRQSALFSTIYGWATLIIGLFFLIQDKKPTRLIYLCGYIVGAELIWRSTMAGIFYEYGKYSITFLLLLAILRYRLLSQTTKWPILYFVLLLPSIIILPFFDRDKISFFLSGPLQLAIATMFFSSIRLTQIQVKRLLVAIIVPTMGIAFLALYSTLTATNLVFNGESNFLTSGGFGPVQVSLQLAFGSLLALYYAVTEKRDRLMVFLMLVVAVWLIAQSIFTFSRSGLYLLAITLVIFFLFYLRRGKGRSRLLLFGAITGLLVAWVVFPYMDKFTIGKLTARYRETTTTGRITLINADLQAFLENPLFGVGPGQSIKYHIAFGQIDSSHTEYTRLLSEHGSLGLISLLILVGFAAKRFFSKTSSGEKSFRMLMTVWALLYMLDITMRTASPGFAFGLGAAWFIFDE